MIELIIKQYLTEHCSIPSFLEYPKVPPDKFIVFEKTGGGKRNQLSNCTIAFQSYASSLYEAAMLNRDLKNLLEDMVILDPIASVRLNSDYNYTDTTTKEYRYQAVYDIYYYEKE